MSKGKKSLFKQLREKKTEQTEDTPISEDSIANTVSVDQLFAMAISKPEPPPVEIPVVEVPVETEEPTKEVTPVKGEAHDIYFCRERRKWIHVVVQYDENTVRKEESYGLNQAIAMKKLHDLITNKMILKRKKGK